MSGLRWRFIGSVALIPTQPRPKEAHYFFRMEPEIPSFRLYFVYPIQEPNENVLDHYLILSKHVGYFKKPIYSSCPKRRIVMSNLLSRLSF
jgi:hypothetical protein